MKTAGSALRNQIAGAVTAEDVGSQLEAGIVHALGALGVLGVLGVLGG